ncbi:hypothetical protein [Arthrobacter sp. SLBN-53]|uniref:hypothetical protein n=1 Tax=Arthrobacter sp. SLBN-53 TaxID=2768412 RepID=UPI00114E2A95|nr:hypothetical protein [Arthrobacter sp. SLBN-53]TQK30591.1 O-antigen/teichoic acid export membrane protein [Arthrobacter sp. SLBN-53]
MNSRFRAAGNGASRLAGFGLSTVLLAVVSVASVPAMVGADGVAAWGAIALGQAVGAVACLVVGYGWNVSGPSIIARGGTGTRRREYADSVRVKLSLLAPAGVLAAAVAVGLSPQHAPFAAAGALSATLVSLTSNWYFAGLARPYTWLWLEIVPRVLSTAFGIALMHAGYGALIGLASTSAGMVIGLIFVSLWVRHSTSSEARSAPPKKPLREILASRRHGIVSMVISQLFLTAPFVIIAVAAPWAQATYALVDKIRQLVSAGLNPIVVVFQGWVPRAADSALPSRSRTALAVTAGLAVAIGMTLIVCSPTLANWLSDRQIDISTSMGFLTACIIAVDLFNSVLAYAVITSFNRVNIVSSATLVSFVALLPTAIYGALQGGAEGVQVAVLCGLVLRVMMLLARISRNLRG